MALYIGVYEAGKDGYEKRFDYNGLLSYVGQTENFEIPDTLSGKEVNFSLSQVKTMKTGIAKLEITRKNAGKGGISSTDVYIGSVLLVPKDDSLLIDDVGRGKIALEMSGIDSIKEMEIIRKYPKPPKKFTVQRRL